MDTETASPARDREPLREGGETARFVTGSTMRHVLVMTGTGSIGLIAIFVVDFLSLLYISWIGDPSLTAGVGLGTIVLFLTTSINVGFMIAVGALVSRALGAGDRARARRLATSSCVHMAAAALLVSALILAILPWLLVQLRASAEVLPIARDFLWITLPSNILMALGMGFSGVLRAVGDARRAMYVTLAAAIVTVFLDPLLIFGLGLGTNGAAIAIVISRGIFAYVGFNGAVRVHDLMAHPRWTDVRGDARAVYAVALPAAATNVATPLANAFFVRILGRYGDEAIAATAIVDRLVPVAFGGLFALSGAVGPILGQNWGARRFDRMRQALRDSVVFMAAYVGAVWLALVLLREPLTLVFRAEGLTAELVRILLRHQRVHVVLHRPALRRERGLQQSGLPAALDRLQLGAGEPRRRAVRPSRRLPCGTAGGDRRPGSRLGGVRRRRHPDGLLDDRTPRKEVRPAAPRLHPTGSRGVKMGWGCAGRERW